MRFCEDKLASLTCSDRDDRPIHISTPPHPKAVILALHGGMAHAGDYVTPALYFRDKAYATVTFRFAATLLGAQTALVGKLSGWAHPVFAVVAGDDKLADATAMLAMLKAIPAPLLEQHVYPDNFHENFNELSRDTIFDDILRWLEQRLSKTELAWRPHILGV